MIEFRNITLEDRGRIERCRQESGNPFSALSFPSLFTWQEAYGLSIAGDSDFFVIKSVENDGFFAPCGNPEKCLHFLEEAYRRNGKIRVLYVTQEMAARAAGDGFRTRHMPELSEYICSTQRLMLKDEHISATYRKKCSRFALDFPYSVRKIQEENIPELLHVIDGLEGIYGGPDAVDLSAARISLQHYKDLGLTGILLRTQKGPIAFSFGFMSAPDIYTMSTVKYDYRLPPEVTAVCTMEEAELIVDPVPYCNLEEDLGHPGLRNAKLQLSPVRMQEVYAIEK